MESATYPFGVSFCKKPRQGQIKVFEALGERRRLNIQLPTGYGKTFTGFGCYAIRRAQGRVNRLLWIVPTDAQLVQLELDGPQEMQLAGNSAPYTIDDIRFFGANAVKRHRKDQVQVFLITVQALIQARGMNNVRELMSTGRWMIVSDEHQHQGIEKAWGKAVLSLPVDFILAMSATPYRPKDDNAFGKPDIIVTYREAYEEGAVKPLKAHAYHYRIDAVLPDGEIHSYTTSELVEEAGGDSPEQIEKFRIARKMRWSPKYVSPLVTIPIDRMLEQRCRTGCKLQTLIKAMSVSHAELVCEQIKTWRPDILVDWIGTGPNGREDKINKEILSKFCPPKDAKGQRHPLLDVLVCVGMAGEGLDAIHISEITHLHRAARNNTNDQTNGRASRSLKAISDGSAIIGNINVDGSSDYADFTGDRIMDAMDGAESEDPDDKPDPDDGGGEDEDWEVLPENPPIEIIDINLENIDSGQLQRVAETLQAVRPQLVKPKWDEFLQQLKTGEGQLYDVLCMTWRHIVQKETAILNDKAIIQQWKDRVSEALASVTRHIIKETHKSGAAVNQSLAGDLKHLINAKKVRLLGAVTHDVEVYRTHYAWLQSLDQEIKDKGVPSWLRLS